MIANLFSAFRFRLLLLGSFNCFFSHAYLALESSCVVQLKNTDSILSEALEEMLQSQDFTILESVGTRSGSLTQKGVLSNGVQVLIKTTKKNDEARLDFEVAAYRLDRLLGFNRVPVSVKVIRNGKLYLVQSWVNGLQGVEYDFGNVVKDELNEILFFDTLIANVDRAIHNLGLKNGRLVLWDHSDSFVITDVQTYRHKTLNRMLGSFTPQLKLSQEARARVLSISDRDIRAALADLSIDSKLIESMLVRFSELRARLL